MTNENTYPFYTSLRFRFGLLFGFIFLLLISVIVFFLYSHVLSSLRTSFRSRLESGAYVILQKTEVNPLTIPLPQKGEFFRLLYNSTKKIDTLYSNLPSSFHNQNNDNWQYITSSRAPEAGGAIGIVYVLPAAELSNSIHRLQALLFICIPLAFVLSLFIGYFLSGFLLQPVAAIIEKANSIDLQSDIALLQAPHTKDELHKLTASLNRMLQRIGRQSQQQNAFFASASHELRTPLSNMLTQLQVLQQQKDESGWQPAIDSQVQEVQRLRRIVNDFLLMSQLKAESLPVNASDTDLIDICLFCIERLQEMANEKALVFRLTVRPENGAFMVKADVSHLQTVLTNLLTNAVKYGKENSVIGLLITSENDTIILQIQNATHAESVSVEKFATEFSRDAKQPQEGFGLGLWLSKQLIEKNDGTLLLRSEDSIFTAEITLRKC